MSNLIVKIRAMPVPEKSPSEDKKPKVPMSLEQRVSYALDCIDAEEHNAHQARDFLQKVRHKIADERLLKQVDEALKTEP